MPSLSVPTDIELATPDWPVHVRVVYRGGYVFVPKEDLDLFAGSIAGWTEDKAWTRIQQMHGPPKSLSCASLFDVPLAGRTPLELVELKKRWIRVTDQKGNMFGDDSIVFRVSKHDSAPHTAQDALDLVHEAIDQREQDAQWSAQESDIRNQYLSDLIQSPRSTLEEICDTDALFD